MPEVKPIILKDEAGSWYAFKSKDNTVRGYCRVDGLDAVCQFAGKTRGELVVERVVWNGKKFVKQGKVG